MNKIIYNKFLLVNCNALTLQWAIYLLQYLLIFVNII